MCYAVYVSTNSPEDLAGRNSELVRFRIVSDSETDPCAALLEFPKRWFVGSKSECSCTFRHTASVELGFTEPVDWYPEDEDALDATRELYRTLKFLVSSGYQVDLVDCWEGAKPADIATADVWLDDVSEAKFRMFENYRFRLGKRADPTVGQT